MLREAVTKSMNGRTHVAGDFLVAEKPQDPNMWHLPVKVQGKPDHRLMGAAWAALNNPNGFRGNKYEGPRKAEAQRKLRAMYRREKLEPPTAEALTEGEDNPTEVEETDGALGEVSEYCGEPLVYRPYGGAKSFADLLAAQKANEAADEIRRFCYQFPELVMNIVSDPLAENKPDLIRKLAGEFSDLVEAALGKMASSPSDGDAEEAEDTQGDVLEFTEALQANAVNFQEVEAPAELTEADKEAGKDAPPRTYAHIDIEAIQPGWGNTKDNNYYPAEVLRRDAHKLIGAKMYESDHRSEEKSTRTWVSTVKELVGFSERGAPIVRAAIHDPGFTQRARNLNELGLLSKLECSIQGQGRARPGFSEGGRKGNQITEFIEIPFLDWVTRAGAGGRAAALVEDAQGGASMLPNSNGNSPAGTTPTTSAPVTAAGETTPAATQETQVTPIHENAPTPAALEKAKVVDLLSTSGLPKPAQDRLAEATYADEAAVQTAIQREIDYVKTLTGSGRPVGMGEAAGSASGNPVDLKEVGKAKAAVNEKFLGPISAR